MGEDETDDAVTAWLQKPLHLKSLVRSQHHPHYNCFSWVCYSVAGKCLTNLLPLPALQAERPPCTLCHPCSAAVPKLLPLSHQAGHPVGYEVLLFIHSLVKGASLLRALGLSPGGSTTGQVADAAPSTHARSRPLDTSSLLVALTAGRLVGGTASSKAALSIEHYHNHGVTQNCARILLAGAAAGPGARPSRQHRALPGRHPACPLLGCSF